MVELLSIWRCFFCVKVTRVCRDGFPTRFCRVGNLDAARFSPLLLFHAEPSKPVVLLSPLHARTCMHAELVKVVTALNDREPSYFSPRLFARYESCVRVLPYRACFGIMVPTVRDLTRKHRPCSGRSIYRNIQVCPPSRPPPLFLHTSFCVCVREGTVIRSVRLVFSLQWG